MGEAPVEELKPDLHHWILKNHDILTYGKTVREQYPLSIYINVEESPKHTKHARHSSPIKMDSSDDSDSGFWFIN